MDDVDSIDAGPELDALIVSEVMGWPEWSPVTLDSLWWFRGPDNCVWVHWADGRPNTRFSPSTEADGALRVLDFFKSPWEISLMDHNLGWTVDLYHPACRCRARGRGPTIRLAICRAAVKAVRERLDAIKAQPSLLRHLRD